VSIRALVIALGLSLLVGTALPTLAQDAGDDAPSARGGPGDRGPPEDKGKGKDKARDKGKAKNEDKEKGKRRDEDGEDGGHAAGGHGKDKDKDKDGERGGKPEREGHGKEKGKGHEKGEREERESRGKGREKKEEKAQGKPEGKGGGADHQLAQIDRQEDREIEKYTWRKARLERMLAVAEKAGKTDKVEKIRKLMADVDARHEKKLAHFERRRAEVRRKEER
jgi:hypothetical protein